MQFRVSLQKTARNAAVLSCFAFFHMVATTPVVAQESAAELLEWASGTQHALVGRVIHSEFLGIAAGPNMPMDVTAEMIVDLRGEMDMELTENMDLTEPHFTCNYNYQAYDPSFPEDGSLILMATNGELGAMQLIRYKVISEEQLAALERLRVPPLGWQMDGDVVTSPWAPQGANTWPESDLAADALTCSVTGRPAYFLGNGWQLSVESVPPAESIQFVNPDGDGEYRVTLTNASDRTLSTNCLLRSGDSYLWNESLVFICEDKAYMLPRAQVLSEQPELTTLEPGESLSAVINVFEIAGPPWHRNGGSRLEFTICLGEMSQVLSFYYFDSHHDSIREAAVRALSN